MERLAVLRPPAGTGVDVTLDLIFPARLHRLLHLPYLGKAAVPLCLVTGRDRAFGDRLLAFPVRSASELIERDARTSDTAPGASELLPISEARERAQDEFERTYLDILMKRAEGSISEGARLAGVSRQFIQRLLRKHGLR